MALTFYCIRYSPWSLKARFALQHHGIDVDTREYNPILDEIGMRLRLRKMGGRITVPILMTPHGSLTDSWDIASVADRIGKAEPLIPREKTEAIAEWNRRSERLLSAGRARSIVRAQDDMEAIVEALPPAIQRRPALAQPLG